MPGVTYYRQLSGFHESGISASSKYSNLIIIVI